MDSNNRYWRNGCVVPEYKTNLKDELQDMFMVLHHMDKLMISSDNDDVISVIKTARETLWNNFSKAFADVKIVDGIKSIKTNRGEIKYYRNGMLELCRWQVVGEPFEYDFNKNKKVDEPKYDSIFRPGDLINWYIAKRDTMPITVSNLVNDYLLSKVKTVKKKRNLNCHKLIQKSETFIQSFDKLYASVGQSDNTFLMFMRKEIAAYRELYDAYRDIIFYCTSGYHDEESPNYSRNIMPQYVCENGKTLIKYDKDVLNKTECVFDKYEQPDSIVNWDIGKTDMPYLDEDDAIELIRLHRISYDNATSTGYTCNNVKTEIEERNDIAKDAAYDFYLRKYKTHNPEVCNKTYEMFGYTSMYYTLKDDIVEGKPHLVEAIIESPQKYHLNIYVEKYKHERLMSSAKTIIENIKHLYRTLYSIPNEDMREFMIAQNILKANYYPE